MNSGHGMEAGGAGALKRTWWGEFFQFLANPLLLALLLELHSAALRGSMVPARKAPLVKTLRQPSLEPAHTFLSTGSSRWGVTRAVRQGGEEAE